MRAAVFEGPQNIVVQDVPDPTCGPDDIIIRTHSCGICGSDLRNYKTGLKGNVKRQVMGHEFTGEVVEVGRNVTRYAVGDPIAAAPDVSCGQCYYCRRGLVNLCVSHRMLGTHWPGGFAEYVHFPPEVLERGMVHHVPDGLDLENAALSEPASSVLAAQERNNVSLGDVVLIIGDGPIGCLHVDVARARGASKIVMVGLNRLKEAKRFEPDLLVDAGTEDPVAVVREFTGGLGADIAICATPVARTQEQAVQSVRKRGIVVLFGGLPKTDPMTSLNSNTIHYDEITVTGAFSYPATIHQKALQVIADGKIDPQKYFTRKIPLDDITDGFRSAAAGEDLKVLVQPGTGA